MDIPSPEVLGEMIHEASRSHIAKLSTKLGGPILPPPWEALEPPVREMMIAIAADVIDKLTAPGVPAERA